MDKFLLVKFLSNASLEDLQGLDLHDCEIGQVGPGNFEAKMGPRDQISEETRESMINRFVSKIIGAGFSVGVSESKII